MFEIHYKNLSVGRVWHLLPGSDGGEGGVAITALCLHEAFSVTGSEDGILRVWSTDFSSAFLEAGMQLSLIHDRIIWGTLFYVLQSMKAV